MKLTGQLILVIFPLITLAACGLAPQEDRLDHLVPDNANLIVQIQVAEIARDPDVAALIASAKEDGDAHHDLNQFLNRSMAETGIDLHQFQEVVLFSDITLDQEFSAVIALGSFDEDRLVAAIQEQAETTVTTTEYSGRQIHIITHADSDERDTMALSLLNDNILVVGSEGAVRAVIDVQEGDRERISGPVYDIFQEQGDVMVRLALAVPPGLAEMDQPPEGFQGMPLDTTALEDLDLLGLSVDKADENVAVRVLMDFTNQESAVQMQNLIGGFVAFMRALTADPETRDMLDTLRLELDETRLTMRLEAPVAVLKKLGDSITLD